MEKFRFGVSDLLRVDAPAIPIRAPVIPIRAPAIPVRAPAIPFFCSGGQVIHRQSPSFVSFAPLIPNCAPAVPGLPSNESESEATSCFDWESQERWTIEWESRGHFAR